MLDETASLYLPSFELKGVHLSHYVHPTVPPIKVNSDRFRQLWRLLLSDQLTHLTHGDAVHIHVHPTTDAHGRPAVRFLVEDTGAWVSDDQVGNLFDPFFVRTHQPTELGVSLTACYVIVHQHSGHIEAASREGGGLRITITLPVDTSGPVPDASTFFERALAHEQRWKDRDA